MLAPVLRPYVVSVTAYDVELGAPGVHRGLPSATLTLVLPLDEPLDVGWAGEPGSRARRRSTLSGLHGRPARIHHDGTQRGIQLALTTAGARALLGRPAADLAGVLVEVGEAAPVLRHLPEQLHDTTDPDRRLRCVERALLEALGTYGGAGPRAEVGRALAGLTRGAGVQQVADEVGLSRRHLSALVRAECGLAPKELQRVARFATSRTLLVRQARAGRPSLARVGLEAGYADQSHLTREWQRLAGCSPGRWLREELPFVQDPEEPDAAG